MSSIKEKERFKEQQEKFQAVLSALLKDEDNKYCVDCDAKGPRWAAWNIGVFLCIRCAGIHRNLGVHISKVKSVNLDSWTPEQVAMMQEMGNSRARAVYEANIPDGFRRPQTDSSLEAFIRSKYEQKKYIAREWIPPQPRVPKEWLEDPKAEKKRARAKQASSTIQLTNVPKTTNKPASPAEETAKPAPPQKVEVKAPAANSASNDLLGLEAAAPPPSSGGNELLDLFVAPQSGQAPANTAPAPAAGSDLMNGATDGSLFGEEKGEEKKTSAKDSIMALYGGGGGGGGVSQPQMYGVPGGVYMSQAQQQMYPGMAGQQQGMMGPQGMMGAQGMRPQQGMVGAQQGMVGQQQGMVGQQHGMVGQQQGMMGTQQGMMGMMGQPQGMMGQPQGMMGQPQGMMGNQGMNSAQMGMYNGQMMSGNPGMYAPQQMQQLQFQQMQQQMTNLKLNGAQMGNMPQQTTSGASGWGNTGQGQTLATNLWQ